MNITLISHITNCIEFALNQQPSKTWTRTPGSINRPSQYPPELIEQVMWQSERLWHAMAAKVALLHAQAQVILHDTRMLCGAWGEDTCVCQLRV